MTLHRFALCLLLVTGAVNASASDPPEAPPDERESPSLREPLPELAPPASAEPMPEPDAEAPPPPPFHPLPVLAP